MQNQPPDDKVNAANHRVSGNHLAHVSKILQRLSWFDATLAQLGHEAAAALLRPLSQRWWSDAIGDEITGTIFNLYGEAGLERFTDELLDNLFTRVLMPVIKVAIAFGGLSPHSLLSRASSLASYSFRGMKLAWNRTGEGAGLLQIEYPNPCSPHTVPQMTVVMRWIFKTTGVQGHVLRGTRSPTGLVVELEIEWDKSIK